MKVYNDSENTGIIEERPKVQPTIEMTENKLTPVKENVLEEERKNEINDENIISQINQSHEVPVQVQEEAQRIFRHSIRKNSDDKEMFKNNRDHRNSNPLRKTSNFNFNNIVYLDENNTENVESEAERLSCGMEKDSPETKNHSYKEYKKSMSFYNLIRSNNKKGLDNQDVNDGGVIYDKEIKINL